MAEQTLAQKYGSRLPALQQQAMARRMAATSTQLKWYGDRVIADTKLTVSQKLDIAAELLRNAVVRNISRPVFKYRKKMTRGPRKGQTVTVVDPASRSKPGEYPKAETTRLMTDIFRDRAGELRRRIGTTLDYGLLLELEMDRSFLRKTLNQMIPTLRRMF
jgi:hypothetical protein